MDDWPDYMTDSVGHCMYALEHGNDLERFNAADILRGLPKEAGPAFPLLLEHMRSDPYWQVRAQCAFAFNDLCYGLGEAANALLPTFIEVLGKDDNLEVRTGAAHAIGAAGLTTASAIDALRRSLSDESEWVREAAQSALERLGERKG